MANGFCPIGYGILKKKCIKNHLGKLVSLVLSVIEVRTPGNGVCS